MCRVKEGKTIHPILRDAILLLTIPLKHYFPIEHPTSPSLLEISNFWRNTAGRGGTPPWARTIFNLLSIHSSCLETFCILRCQSQVLFGGAEINDTDTDNHNLRRYVCTTSTCNGKRQQPDITALCCNHNTSSTIVDWMEFSDLNIGTNIEILHPNLNCLVRFPFHPRISIRKEV